MWIAGHDIDGLDGATREYLKKLRTLPVATLPGVMVPRSQLWVAIVFPLAFGILCLWLAWLGLQPGSLFDKDSAWLECLGWALGFMLTYIGVIGLKRRLSRDYIGRFILLDGSYYWEVGFHRIRILDVSAVVQIKERVYRTNGQPTKRTLVIRAQNGSEAELAALGRRTAGFARFLQTCIQLRQRRSMASAQVPPAMLPFLNNPGGLAYVANQLASQNGAGKVNVRLNWSEVVPIPRPVFAPQKKWKPGWPARCLGLGALVFILTLAVAGMVRSYLDELYHYQAVIHSAADDTGTPQGYLAAFPNGRHVAEVKGISDDRSYTVASSQATRDHSPAALRDYLANTDNMRHRFEAEQQINTYYDEAVDRVRQLATQQDGEKPLLQGLLSLLDKLKASSSPVVHLGFDPHWAIALPGNDEANQLNAIELNDEDIRQLWLKKGRDVLVDPSGAFTDKLVHGREGLILQRFQEALGRILSTDLITCQLGTNLDDCQIKVQYGIRPAGRLRKYTMTTQTPFSNGGFGGLGGGLPVTNTIGLLRDYEINWRVQIRPDNNSNPYEFTVKSDPAKFLSMTSHPNDPPWAPYAVTLYSAFYDFSGRMVASVGLPVPPAPTHFQFSEPF